MNNKQDRLDHWVLLDHEEKQDYQEVRDRQDLLVHQDKEENLELVVSKD